MNVFDILSNLNPYLEMLTQLQKEETMKLTQEPGFVKLSKSVSNRYSFITLELTHIFKSDDEEDRLHDSLYVEIRFEIVRNQILLTSVYHKKASEKEMLEKWIGEHIKTLDGLWKENTGVSFFQNNEITQSLLLAEEIAEQSCNCAHGDNYHPGNYSEVNISDEYIQLDQINHMNAKSLAHKENYSLRNLEMKIPFEKQESRKLRYNVVLIGALEVDFSDRSSANNRPCGEAIQKKIEEIMERKKV